MSPVRAPGSFRDPAGQVFVDGDEILRVVRPAGAERWEKVRASGFLESAIEEGLLVRHEELSPDSRAFEGEPVRALLRAERIPFVSHPYEWCVSQLREAALLTLRLQRRALDFGLSLRDASAFNVQFRGSAPVFIDTLSFEPYVEGRPWVAYRQFCEHFLAPLALAVWREPRLLRLLRAEIDGVPLPLAQRLLPVRTRLRPGLLLHLHLHARAQRRHADAGRPKPEGAVEARSQGEAPAAGGRARLSRSALQNLLESLAATVRRLRWEPPGGVWTEYEQEHDYTSAARLAKEEGVRGFLARPTPARVLDLGANTGFFSRMARQAGAHTVALDADPGVIERLYREARAEDDRGLLPLVMDLANPSPDLGFAGGERESLLTRSRADLVLALALVHHLALTHNVPLPEIAALMARLARRAVVEFVPREDPQVRRLLASREDVFHGYHEKGFQEAFARWFTRVERIPLPESGRVLFLFERRESQASPAPGAGS